MAEELVLDEIACLPAAAEIEAAAPEDAAEIVRFLRQFPEVCCCEWEEEALVKKAIRDARGLSFVARRAIRSSAKKDRSIVGVIMAGKMGLRGTINHLAVAHWLRRRNIGRMLVERSLSQFRAQGIFRIFLFTAVNSAAAAAAIPFWNRLGFRVNSAEITYEKDL